jgi:hypothetical protein
VTRSNCGKMKEQTKRNHLNHSPAPSAHSTRSYLSSYLAHAHSPSPSIKSQKPLPPVKSRGVGVNEKPPSRHDHLQIISDFHQALTTFQSLQINTVEWSLGMKESHSRISRHFYSVSFHICPSCARKRLSKKREDGIPR